MPTSTPDPTDTPSRPAPQQWCQLCNTPPEMRFNATIDAAGFGQMLDHIETVHAGENLAALPADQIVTVFYHRIKVASV
jgi:hypothetical protein